MVLLSGARRERSNWSSWQLLRFFVTRGVVLILLGFVVRAANEILLIDPPERFQETIGKPAGLHILLFFWQVMTSLGLSMIATSVILSVLHVVEAGCGLQDFRLRLHPTQPLLQFGFQPMVLFLLGCACAACTTITIHYAQHGDPASANPKVARSFLEVLNRFVLIPGVVPRASAGLQLAPEANRGFLLSAVFLGPFLEDYMTMAYPLVPWLGICLWGAATGFEFKSDPSAAHRRALLNGILLLAAFPLVRFFGGRMFNLRGLPMGEGRAYPWNAFWVICKYPPGSVFALFVDRPA
jgi:hypothetical protein